MSNCTSCSKELVPNAKFCKFCGATQAVQPQPVNEIPVVAKVNTVPACIKCGNALIPNAKFCKHCGTNVDAPHVATLPITETPKVAVAELVNTNPTTAVLTPTKSNATKYAFTGILAALLVSGVGYWGWANTKAAEEQKILVAKQQAEAEAQKIAAEAEQKEKELSKLKLLGVDLKLAIEKIIPDEKAYYSAPDPVTVVNAFKPCKLKGVGGELHGNCKLNTNGNLLVEENVKDDRRVYISTIGPRSMIEQISLDAKFPNNIQDAFTDIKDWNIKEVNCGQDNSLAHWTIYTAKPSGKREFVFETTFDGGSGGYHGTLKIHLLQIADNKPCSLVELNAINQEVSDMQNVNEPQANVIALNTNSSEHSGKNSNTYDGATALSCNGTVDCNSQSDVIAKMTKRWVSYSTKTHYGNICFEAIARVKGIPAQVWSAGLASNQMEVCNMQ